MKPIDTSFIIHQWIERHGLSLPEAAIADLIDQFDAMADLAEELRAGRERMIEELGAMITRKYAPAADSLSRYQVPTDGTRVIGGSA